MKKSTQNLYTLGAAYYPDYISQQKTLTRRVDSGHIEWLETKERMAEDFKRMEKQGIHTIRMGEFSWATVEPSPGQWKPEIFLAALDLAQKHKIDVIFCTPTATPPKWLIDAHPDILPVTRNQQTIPFGSRRHYDFHHPEYRKESKRITELFAKTFGSHPAVKSWQTDNEFGCHNSVFLYTKHARNGFRNWLANKYKGEIEALNENWFTCFWSQHYRSFDEIELPFASWADQNPHLELDFRRFSNELLCDFQRDQIEIIRRHSAQRPVTHNLMTLFTDLCPWKASEDLDYVGFDHYQMESEPHPITSAWQFALMRSLKQKPFLILEQQPLQVNWQPTNRRFSFDWLFLWGLQSAFQGASGMLYFSWQRMPGGCEQYHDGVVPHDVRIEKSQQEKMIDCKNQIFAQISDEFALNRIPSAAHDVLCLHDSESLWSHEITSQSVTYSTRKQLDHITQFCAHAGLGLWFTDRLEKEEKNLAQYKLIILPGHAFELTQHERTLLQTFRSKGGRVLSFPRTAYKERSNKLSPLPAVFYSADDFYLDDYGAMLEQEMESIELNDSALGSTLEGILWSEKIVLTQKSWSVEARFSNKSIFAGSPAIIKRKEDAQHGAHVHLATCLVPTKETFSALRKLLQLPTVATAQSAELQLQHITEGSRRFLAAVHFGQHETSAKIGEQEHILKGLHIALNPDLTPMLTPMAPDEQRMIRIPGRSAVLIELKN